MCGIAGTIGVADEVAVRAMTAALAHRGPDDADVRVWPEQGLAFGHRRLAIIDTSAAGHQPMGTPDGRFWITFNGEIYNYRDVRRDLQALGHTFTTQTDTEVLLAAYAQWGEGCLPRLRGMFAFALADFRREHVVLARDRFGIKPLLYHASPKGLTFASELSALLASGRVSARLDRTALWYYLSLGSVPQPRTMVEGVQALLPGHVLTVRFDGTPETPRRWYDLETAAATHRPAAATATYAEAAETLRVALEEATRYHLVADVPVGAFLSGGIDSAAMVALMSQHVSSPIRTFTVGFESQHQTFSEADQAAETARYFGTDHTAVTITDREAAQAFEPLVAALDQPSMDGANTWFVSRAATRDVKVALTGLGGDELFAGYPHFQRHARAARCRHAMAGLHPLLAPLRLLPDRCRHNLMLPALTEVERLATLRCLTSDREKLAALSPDFLATVPAPPLTALYAPGLRDGLDTVAQISLCEIEGYMARTLLRDGDVMSMAHALETRPILLDHHVAEWAFALPSAYKIRQGQGKAVFYAALESLVPESIRRRPKRGFELPLLRWLAGPLKDRARDALTSSTAQQIFRPRFLNQASARLENPDPRDFRLWPIVILIEWLRLNPLVSL